MTETQTTNAAISRAAWMRLLALSDWKDLAERTRDVINVRHDLLRKPETGLMMMRGRMGATGAAFNLGEATVTRCAVKLASGEQGHAYVMGRNAAHAHAAAICDALMQSTEHSPQIREQIIDLLAIKLRDRRMAIAGKAAATKVDFFTMMRGDD
jgi:alpha-D-ribose 1-methylphosphonate 5-triphosphate synthase subunit PhnG